MKFAAAVEEKDGVKRAAGYALARGDDEDLVDGLQPGKTYAFVGVVREDGKGNLTLALSKAVPQE